MNRIKKFCIRTLISIYGISYFLQNSFFIDRKKIYAAENPDTTNIVAVFVDKEIYPKIKADLLRYTTKYIQGKIANSKAVVLPIDTKTLKAHEIAQILENMYFEGLKDASSKLIGTILIGDIPLPVVQNNGFIYPSIYPYVDFEDQQFVYDTNKKFFIYNDNPNGQAELWHGIIKFEKADQYTTFFNKIKSYTNNPADFIDQAIWYDDFIGLKKYFIKENSKYYLNSIIFAEDIGYHRYTSLLLDTLKQEHNSEALDIGDQLVSDMENTQDEELQEYTDMIEDKNNEAKSVLSGTIANIPTMTLQAAIQEMTKSYDGLIGSTFLSQIKNNIAGLARRYTNIEGESFDNIQGSTQKINQQDNWIIGDVPNNIPGLLIQINEYLESGLNTQIEDQHYYLNVPIPVSYLNFNGEKKRGKCTWATYDYYHNYYFGTPAQDIQTAQQTSIYRGTYQNLTTLNDQSIQHTGQSIGGSYKVFSTQVEANRGYNIYNAQDELDLYNSSKTSKQDLRGMQCPKYLFNRERLNICIKKRVWQPDNTADEDKCNIEDEEQQGGCESMTGFAQRMRGGASPLNYNVSTNTVNYQYKNARLPIYDIAGSKKINSAEPAASSFSGINKYTALIQEKFAAGDLQRGNSLWLLMHYPQNNGNDLMFTNQYPQGSLRNPTGRTTNIPLSYSATNYFTLYNILPHRSIDQENIMLYTTTPGECGGTGSIVTYKTLDSRVLNTAPTRNQISDSQTYKFHNGSALANFYTNTLQNISGAKTDIITTTQQFSTTGVVNNLSAIQEHITTYNQGVQNIRDFTITSLGGYDTDEIAELADTWSENNISLVSSLDIHNKISHINTGLLELLDRIDTTTLGNTLIDIQNIQQQEKLKNQEVEILTTRKTDILNSLTSTKTKYNIMKATFLQAQSMYNSLGRLTTDITGLQAKKASIAALQGGNGCNGTYARLCTTLDIIIDSIQTYSTSINTSINNISGYQNGEVGANNTPITIQPFVQINQAFLENTLGNEITQIQTSLQTFDTTNNIDKKETTKGMNLITQDRPIDSIRNITFKGVGGDTVRLDYPNIYEVKTYKQQNNRWVLKTPNEIKTAIKTYLIGKANEYNTLLSAQLNKKNQYYQAFKNQFITLGQADTRANPNNHNYDILPSEYFVDRLIEYLDTLEETYGTNYIYGNQTPDTDDEKIDMLAKFLYQQNNPRPERTITTNVEDDISEIKSSFDINQKINNVVHTYLTKDNDQGKFLTPTYNQTGYEVGFINSDGEDYVSAKEAPSFIQKIQEYQTKETAPLAANAFIEDETQTNSLQQSVNTCEGVDTNGSALLFDFKSFSSPWSKAMVCWAKKTREKPFDIKVNFNDALGPTILGTFQQIKNTLENVGTQREEYGKQRSLPNNEELINQAEGTTKTKLQGYTTYATINIDKNKLDVTTTGNNNLTIGMTQDVGMVKLRITGTGDNCFGLSKANGTTISKNICTSAAKQFYNPYTQPETFTLQLQEKKAGTTSVYIQLCTPTASQDICITKSQIVQILPGPVTNITITTPTNKVIEGGELPLQITATDKYGNKIGQTVESYTLSVGSGQGALRDGASTTSTREINNFQDTTYIYQAPTNITTNTAATITIAPTQQKLLTTTSSQTVTSSKQIDVVQGILTIMQGETKLYQTNASRSTRPQLSIQLPNNQEDIQYIDEHDIAQINPEAIATLQITLKDNKGNPLESVANITSTHGILHPGTIITNNITRGTQALNQTKFQKANNFIIQSGSLNLALYPSFKAGDDKITINIPGNDPIIIQAQVQAGEAKKVLMTIKKTKLDTTNTTTTTGTIQVVDTRNNKVTQATKIKLDVLGPATINTQEFMYSGKEYTYTITTKQPGGEGYVFAYIDTQIRALSDQIPGYKKFIVQESILPQENLNIMYLNLFGSDRGNQRGYFSENDKLINTVTAQSDKLLATTTQLVDPNKIKQIEYIIDPNGQVQSINEKLFGLTIDNGKLTIQLPDVATIYMGKTQDFIIQQLSSTGDINNFSKDTNTLLYIPEPTDSIITGNQSTKTSIRINGKEIINTIEGTVDANITITADNEMIADMSSYTMRLNDTIIGKLLVRNSDNEIEYSIIDPLKYGKTDIFTQGSTNTHGIGIYITTSAFTKQGYMSIEDSADSMAGIGFSSKFKNIANFANGEYVGEATVPYGSQFLINFGDPLLERNGKNTQIPDTDFDASLGQTIYTDPQKTLFKTVPIDFNNDSLQDLLVIYTDGTIKLIKNYGGTEQYKNLQELMIIAEPIKDIQIGDVDGNKYDDIIVITNNSKGIVYLNQQGIFPVDGRYICLNTNAEPNTKTQNPSDFGNIYQLFIQDADQDGKTDIITNDTRGDIKIFYGGSTSKGVNYLSSTTGTCDAQRYTRQKANYKTIKRLGLKINNSRYIQDESLIHWKGIAIPKEGSQEEPDEQAAPISSEYTGDNLKKLKKKSVEDVKGFTQNLSSYIAAGTTQLAYTQNPGETAPIYENLEPEEIYYLPINEQNQAVSVYKEYRDINGGILRDQDTVVVHTTILSHKNNNKLTYIDMLKGPRSIAKNTDNSIPSFIFTTDNTRGITIDWNAPEGYQFTMDNIQLRSGQKLSFSYQATYTQETALTKISVQDRDLLKQGKSKDGYVDIGIQSSDTCQKGERILFNENTRSHRTYEEIFNDIQAVIDSYTSGAQMVQTQKINSILDQIQNISNIQEVTQVQGVSSILEQRTNDNLLTPPLTLSGIASILSQGSSISLETNAIDSATNTVTKKLQETLQGLCQGFTIGKNKGNCQGVPVPFNEAFLAPGAYHIFGCVPQLPNPLYVPFQMLNQTLGKGLPILAFPTNAVPFVWPINPAGAGGIFQGETSQFRLYLAPTLTLGLGIAMCFLPYSVGGAIPKPFNNLGGNCIVFALPPLSVCTDTTTNNEESYQGPTTDIQDEEMTHTLGTCNAPASISNTMIVDTDNEHITQATTVSTPLQLVAANAQTTTPHYSAAIPEGNFGGLIVIDKTPITIASDQDVDNLYDGYEIKRNQMAANKILGAKTKGLVQCMVQDRSTRQIQYIQNNLTKMTIQIDLPDITTMVEGFDKIGNLKETYAALNAADTNAGYIQKIGSGTNWTQKFSKQQINNISQQLGNNPFQAIQKIFEEVPLINIETKALNIKVPALTTDDIKQYQNYGQLWIQQNQQTLQDWEKMITAITALCGQSEIKENINKTTQLAQELKELTTIAKPTTAQTERIAAIQQLQSRISVCNTLTLKINDFIHFQANTEGLITSFKENINVLEQYKAFPTQLYEWTHVSDRYLTETSLLLSGFVGNLNYRLNTNANRFSQYVDAIILIGGAIQTRQAVIDFSVNRSEKCSKCSNDNYGSFSCSLSFLCPKLPILPIPAFKIPNIYMDMSHIDLGMNITLPKINFVPVKIALPQIPNIPEPPSTQINRDILYQLEDKLNLDVSLPTIPVIPQPPTLPELPSFIPTIKMDLPVLPPAPKIPKILPEIDGILNIAEFVGKIFCIVKGGIGLVGEKGVKAKVEQITQRTRNVPVFDYFNMTTKFKDPPLQGFDYKMDAYTTLKFNFDEVYNVFDNIAQAANNIVSQQVEAPVNKAIDRAKDKVENNIITTGAQGIIDGIDAIDQDVDFNGYLAPQETMEYATAYTQLKQGLKKFETSAASDKVMQTKVKTILAMIDNKSSISPATKELHNIHDAAQTMIDQSIQANKQTEKDILEYDTFIQNLKEQKTVLVANTTNATTLTSPLLHIDNHSKTIIQNQENPNKSYLSLNKTMVDGYLKAIQTDGPEKLNMTQSTYDKSKTYLETTKNKIDTALLAYNDQQTFVAASTCTTCTDSEEAANTYTTDMSAYVQGVFVESYSGTDKSMINTLVSTQQTQQVQNKYSTNIDLNNDQNPDILMYDTNTIYIKYANQQTQQLSEGGNQLTTYYKRFYSYASEHPRNRYISSLDQLRENSDAYGYTDINDITIKLIDTTTETKNFKTDGQTFDSLKLSWTNSTSLGETVDGYIIRVSNKIDDKESTSSFRDFLGRRDKANYILLLPQDSSYTTGLLTIDDDMVKHPISLALGERILAVQYFDPNQKNISISLSDLPRKWLYTSIANLQITQGDLSASQQKRFTLYKKSSPRSNQTVAGMQNLGDTTPPVGEMVLWRDMTQTAVSTGATHEGFINTHYTLKGLRSDNVVVSKMIIQQDGVTIFQKDNYAQTGNIDISGLFFTGTNEQSFDFIAIDQNNNIAKETVKLTIHIPDIEITDLKKSGEETADVIAKISNDLDEGMVIFQRLRNGVWKNIQGSNQNDQGGFSLSPNQTIITGGIFTIGNTLGMYNNQGDEIATIDPKTGEITINEAFAKTIVPTINFSTHIPVLQLKDTKTNTILFDILLPIKNITDVQLHAQTGTYEKILLQDKKFGDFNNGYCIQNNKNECILYTHPQGAIYVPGTYAYALRGDYSFDKKTNHTIFTIKDQSNTPILTITAQVQSQK